MICCFMHFDFSHIHRTIKNKEIMARPTCLKRFIILWWHVIWKHCNNCDYCSVKSYSLNAEFTVFKDLNDMQFFSELIWQNAILFTEQCFMQFCLIPRLQLDGQCEHLAPIFFLCTSFSVHFQSFKLMGLFMNWIFIKIFTFVQEQDILTVQIFQ